MKKIKYKSFFDSENKSFLISVAIYKEDIFYKIITEIGSKGTLVYRMTEFDANDFFNEEVKGIISDLNNRGVIFNTYEA